MRDPSLVIDANGGVRTLCSDVTGVVRRGASRIVASTITLIWLCGTVVVTPARAVECLSTSILGNVVAGLDYGFAYATVCGLNSTASGLGATALGYNASAGTFATAIGGGVDAPATAAADYSLALGNATQASGTGATAIGTTSAAAGSILYQTVASGVSALAMQGGTARGDSSIAIGIGSSTANGATNAVAFGQGATSLASGAFALGSGSIATVANTVSIGSLGNERRLVNLATGVISSTSTDGVNGGQLFSANQRVANALGGGTTLDTSGNLTAPSYTILGTTYTSVGGALGGLNTQVTANTARIVINTNDITALQNQISNTPASLLQQDGTTRVLRAGGATDGSVFDVSGTAGNRTLTGLAAGAVTATSADAMNGGQLFSANQRVANALGGGTTLDTSGNLTAPSYTILGTTYTSVGGALGGLNTQVTANTARIVINTNDITALQNQISNAPASLLQQDNTTRVLRAGGTTDGSVFDVSGTAGNRTLTGLAPGAVSATSADAMNGGQLFSANQRVANALGGGTTLDTSGSLTAPSYNILGTTYSSVGGALGGLNTQVAANTASIAGLQQSVAGNSSSLLQQDSASRVIGIGKTSDGTIFDVSGSAGNRLVTGVSAGTLGNTSSDAVNGAQLYATNQSVAANSLAISSLSSVVSSMSSNPSSPYVRSNGSGPVATASGSNASAIGSGANASGDEAIAVGTNSQATRTGAIAVGVHASSTGTNAIAIGTNASATGSVAVGYGASAANGGAAFGDGAVAIAPLSTAVGPNSSATAANAVAIGSGSTNTVANTVSVGSAGNERRITNVAAGISQTDVVNVAQLSSIASGMQTQIGDLQSQINDNRLEARNGVALAMAASGLRYDDRPGKLSVTGAAGTYHGSSGLALGVGYAATDRLRFNAAVSGAIAGGSYGAVIAGSVTLN